MRLRPLAAVLITIAAPLAACGDAPTQPELQGPVFPVPSGLWSSPFTPASKKSFVFRSDVGDFIGQGLSVNYTAENSSIQVKTVGTGVVVIVNEGISFEDWTGYFFPMKGLTVLKPGYYADLKREPALPFGADSLKARMDWNGHFRGCNSVTGWFAVDRIEYVSGQITALDIRFQQHCDGTAPALRGAIRLSP
jgi:hypothetical protein